MDSIISQILSIEKKAQEMVAEAESEKEQILTNTKNDCETIKRQMKERRAKRMETLEHSEQERAQEQMDALRAEYAKKTQSLEAVFRQKKDGWVEEIYQNIIGR